MKVLLVLVAFLLGNVCFAEYTRNPATCVCYYDNDPSSSLRIRFRNGAVEALAIDKLDVGHFGDDIVAKKLGSDPYDSNQELYQVNEMVLSVPVNAQAYGSQSSVHWRALIIYEQENLKLGYNCSF